MADAADIHPKMQAEQAFQAIARRCVERFRRYLTELRQSWDAEAVHQARVGLRQLLAAFSLFRPMIDDEAFPALRDRCKAVARFLGEARDLDIILEAARQPDLPAVRSAVSRLRPHRYADLMQRLEKAGNRHLAEDLYEWIDHGAWRKRHKDLRHERLRDFAGRRLDRKWRKFRESSRHLGSLAPRPRHKVRIAAKQLRYGFEFMAPLAKSRKARARWKALVEPLMELQDALGKLNDMRTETRIASHIARRSRSAAFAAGRFMGVEQTHAASLLRQAGKAARRLRRRKPFWR